MNTGYRAKLIKRIITFECLAYNEYSALLRLLSNNKNYGLLWEDKLEDIEECHR